MKKLIFCALCALCASAHADEIVAATIRADGSTNTWTQADLQEALGLMNRMYWRDMADDSGRRRWHGDRIGQYILTNNSQLVRIDLYADGFVATNHADRARRPVDPEAAEKERQEAQRKAEETRRAWEAANLPPELAALREAQRQAAQTQTVTVVTGP